MTTTPTLAVTGATGVLGGFVARYLADRGIAQRLLVRTPAKAPALPESTVHQFSYSDQDAATTALRGVETLFMVSAHESAERLDQHRTFIDAAASAGVKHVVYTSFAAAAPGRHLYPRTGPLRRPRNTSRPQEWIGRSFATASTSTSWKPSSAKTALSAARQATAVSSFVARADVARTAAAILANPGAHAAHTYNLTGPEALTLDEVAATISRVRGRHVTFHNETLDEAYGSRAGYGAPDWQLDAWVSTYTAIASNELAPSAPPSTPSPATRRAPSRPTCGIIRDECGTLNRARASAAERTWHPTSQPSTASADWCEAWPSNSGRHGIRVLGGAPSVVDAPRRGTPGGPSPATARPLPVP